MPLTDEEKKAQTHNINRHAFDVNNSDAQPSIKWNTPKNQEEDPEAKLKATWSGMTQRQRVEYLSRPDLTADDLKYLDETLGITKSHPESSITAGPNLMTIKGLKEEALTRLGRAASWLPTAAGAVGGYVTQKVAPESGPLGKAAGSGLGGAIGEVGRQAILHTMGQDDPDYTWNQRGKDVLREAAMQAGSELVISKLAKALRPTMDKSIDKIVAAGGLGPTDTKGIESVMSDLVKAEKKAGNQVLTIGDFHTLLNTTKREIGNEVDLAMAQKVNRNGQMIPLGNAKANTNPVFTRIHDLLAAHPSEASGAVADNPVKRKAIEHRALQYAMPRTFRELTDRRIILNNRLAAMYDLPKGEQRAFLLGHPELEIDKAEADAIRDVIYPEMDIASGRPLGTTEALQKKRGAIMSLENAFETRIGKLHADTRDIAGHSWWERGNVSTYGTTSGKPGIALHRLGSLVHKPNPEANASAKVARAFGNKLTTKAEKGLTTPVGTEILSIPLRSLFNPEAPEKDDQEQEPTNDQEPTQPQGISSLRELREEAERRRPQQVASSAQSPVAVTHIYDPISGEIKAV